MGTQAGRARAKAHSGEPLQHLAPLVTPASAKDPGGQQATLHTRADQEGPPSTWKGHCARSGTEAAKGSTPLLLSVSLLFSKEQKFLNIIFN